MNLNGHIIVLSIISILLFIALGLVLRECEDLIGKYRTANQKIEYLTTELAKLKPLETTLEIEIEKWKRQADKHVNK